MGFAAFTGVKLVGYTIAALTLKKAFSSADSSVFRVGLARTGIGLVAGTFFGAIWIPLFTRFENRWPERMAAWTVFGLLIPIRLAEWSLLIHFFFDRGLVQGAKDLKFATLGSLRSFVLDGVGMLAAFVVPGGFWIG
jgi:hypothetical protein